MKRLIAFSVLLAAFFSVQAQETKLPPPVKTGGKPFMETVAARHSERAYVKREMPPQMLSSLLWAANGFNRDGKRTVATAWNKQEMAVYVVLDDGAYLYDAQAHALKLVAKGDFKKALGQPEVTNIAALSIVMVADLNKSSIDNARIGTGGISQSIYLFAASEGLGTVARGSFKAAELAKALKLNSKQAITLVQPVGFLK